MDNEMSNIKACYKFPVEKDKVEIYANAIFQFTLVYFFTMNGNQYYDPAFLRDTNFFLMYQRIVCPCWYTN